MQNRVIRLRDAPKYLGMDKNRFNREVRPHVMVIRIGQRGIGFDRLDLDAWLDNYKYRSERSEHPTQEGEQLWDAKTARVSIKEITSGTSKKQFMDEQYEKVRKLVI